MKRVRTPSTGWCLGDFPDRPLVTGDLDPFIDEFAVMAEDVYRNTADVA
ncbi:hypothetical protein ACWDYH_39645 [Nocardia goodfellowii]